MRLNRRRAGIVVFVVALALLVFAPWVVVRCGVAVLYLLGGPALGRWLRTGVEAS